MKIKKVNITVYETEDGKRFDSEDEALNYSLRKMLFDKYDSVASEDFMNSDEVVDWLIENKSFVADILSRITDFK